MTIPEAIDQARKRNDHALCDMLIGAWILYCALFEQAPLPDLPALAEHINQLPSGYRSSVDAAIGVLKREAIENARLRRDLDALLSWLPIVDVAPQEDTSSQLQAILSEKLWSRLNTLEQQRLIELEETFLRLRRLSRTERDKDHIRSAIVDWLAIAEGVLRRLQSTLNATPESDLALPLGMLLNGKRRFQATALRSCGR